jgi:hypothetical protein
MSEQPFGKLTTFLKQLDQANIYYTLASHREDTIMVLLTVPGERWEIEFLGDGSVEVERFISNGEICGEEALHELFTTHADREHTEAV